MGKSYLLDNYLNGDYLSAEKSYVTPIDALSSFSFLEQPFW